MDTKSTNATATMSSPPPANYNAYNNNNNNHGSLENILFIGFNQDCGKKKEEIFHFVRHLFYFS
jgi:hypothetical protein